MHVGGKYPLVHVAPGSGWFDATWGGAYGDVVEAMAGLFGHVFGGNGGDLASATSRFGRVVRQHAMAMGVLLAGLNGTRADVESYLRDRFG